VRIPRLVTGLVVVAAALAMTAVPAAADPPSQKAPVANSIVGVGSDTIEYVFDQFSHDYNASHSSGPKLYSWDATNPATGAIGDEIKFKQGCTAEPRPDGSGAGLTAVSTNQGGSTGGHPCEDFGRSSSARSTTAPPYAAGGVAYVTLAGDAVTWAAEAGSPAPRSLTPAQLTGIYSCSITNWGQVGGKNAPILPFLPQTSSGTRSFFLKAIGVTTPGACVSDGNNLLEENEGYNSLLHNPDAIFPYSIGKYIAEVDHSASCIKSSCAPVGGVSCHPSGSQNEFGCNTHGSMVLHEINGVVPTNGSGRGQVINQAFPSVFVRTLFEIVRFAPATADHIPAYLEPFFGASGWVCTSSAAKQDLLNYGFIILPSCGHTD
jgi:ABC-type phosphate transport system substrate-binding protein